jgi:hypothetical protein
MVEPASTPDAATGDAATASIRKIIAHALVRIIIRYLFTIVTT